MRGHEGVFVRIFNQSQEVVLERVTRFSYVHSEKQDDASTFVIETNQVDIVDDPNLQEGKVLVLVWGYMGGKTRKQTIWIWDTKPTFTADGVRFEITGYCKKAYMKLGSSKNVYNQATMDAIAKSMAGAYELKISSDELSMGETATTYGGQTSSQLLLPDFDGKVDEDGNPLVSPGEHTTTVARDNTTVVLQKPLEFKEYKEGIPQAGKSDSRMLDDMAEIEPVENLFVTGRDDELIIAQRNLFQAPYKSYKYKDEPGYLISFTPASKNSSLKKQAIANSVSGWEEEEKAYIQGGIGSSHVGAGVLGDMMEISDEQKILSKVAKDEDNPFDRPVTVDGFFRETYEGTDENGNKVFKKEHAKHIGDGKDVFVHWTKRGTRRGKEVIEEGEEGFKKVYHTAGLDTSGRIETKGFSPYDAKETLTTIETEAEEIAKQGVVRKAKKELELREGTATVIGDPELESSKVITFLGLGKKYSGNYYIFHVEHSITPEGGYLCNIKHYRNGVNKVGGETDKFIDVSRLGRYKNKVVSLPQDGTMDLKEIPINKDR